jgi:predicted nucleic-acid-binding protein
VPQRARAESRPPSVHLLDTNVILRFLIEDDPPKATRAIRLMERVERGREGIEISEAVLTEAVWTLERFYKVPRNEISQKLIALLSFRGVRMASRESSIQALQYFANSHADFVDCLLAADSKLRRMPIYTFDVTDFPKLGADWKQP